MVAIAHAMEYETWRSLTDKGLCDAEAGDLVLRLVSAVGSGAVPPDAGSIGGP
jgi:hypothetical protein